MDANPSWRGRRAQAHRDRRRSLVSLFSLSGCMLEVSSGGPTGSFAFTGPVFGFPITGTYSAQLVTSPPVGNCATLEFATTLTDAAGNTVTKSETVFGCLVSNASTVRGTFLGSYTVTGGTGIYAGASGSGTTVIDLTVVPLRFIWTITEFGTFDVPGTATSADERTFRMKGRVASVKQCGTGGDAGDSKICKNVSAKEVARLLSR